MFEYLPYWCWNNTVRCLVINDTSMYHKLVFVRKAFCRGNQGRCLLPGLGKNKVIPPSLYQEQLQRSRKLISFWTPHQQICFIFKRVDLNWCWLKWITRGCLSDFTQLPLETLNALHKACFRVFHKSNPQSFCLLSLTWFYPPVRATKLTLKPF